MSELAAPDRRAQRLLRWYPSTWRLRYGDEFTELLLADIVERPRSLRRALDVARSGLAVRLGYGGSVHGLAPCDRASVRLASFVGAGSGFLLVGAAMWAQLAIGWQWSRPAAPTTAAAVLAMSCLVAALAALAAVAAIPVVLALAVRLVRGRVSGLVIPLALLVAGTALVILGARHFALGWPGTGGHPWLHQHLVPHGAAAFAWAATLSLTSYWAHPGALLAFPASEIAWMAASPVALVCSIVGAAKIVRRLELSPRTLRFELVLTRIAGGAMILFVAAACLWIAAGDSGPRNLFHIGAIDLVGVGVLCASLLIARRASKEARDALSLVAGQR